MKRETPHKAPKPKPGWMRSTSGPIYLQVVLSESDADLLRKLAHKEDRPMASIVRLALRERAADAGIEGGKP